LLLEANDYVSFVSKLNFSVVILNKMLFMKKLSVGKKDKPLADELINMMLPYKNCVKTIICDKGTEFSDFKRVQKKLDLQFS